MEDCRSVLAMTALHIPLILEIQFFRVRMEGRFDPANETETYVIEVGALRVKCEVPILFFKLAR